MDGQQRLTTLTLLLMYLYRRLQDAEDKSVLQDLIFSRVHGTRLFNLHVEERTPCMEALFSGQPFDPTDRPESVQNLVARYRDIETLFPARIDDAALPLFADWLIENVHLVAITAYSDEDAYTIFETMNDRGLRLTPLDILKGYLLANIEDERGRITAAQVWKEQTTALMDVGKDEDSNAVKEWLRSQYANTIRERKRGACHCVVIERLRVNRVGRFSGLLVRQRCRRANRSPCAGYRRAT